MIADIFLYVFISSFDTNYMFVSFDAVSKMFKSKKTMQEHKRKQSQMSRPTSAFQATARPSFPTHMQTAGQAIDNTNPPSSAFQAMARPSFPTHMQTAGQAIDNTNPPSSAFQATVRPSFPT